MGTRSLTHIISVEKFKDGKETKSKLVTMYRQMDGYPKGGHGEELATFLNGGTLVNGLGSDDPSKYLFNGAGCLAAAVVYHFKKETRSGGIYLYKPGTTGAGEEYAYDVIVTTDWSSGVTTFNLTIKCFDIAYPSNRRKLMFSGTPAEFLAWVDTL